MQGLDPSTIASLMQGTRQRNAYGPKLLEFMESDEAAICPAEVWPLDFGGKASSTLYQGFLLAAKKAEIANDVLIKQSDDKLFLVHKERAQLLMETAALGYSRDRQVFQERQVTHTH